MPLSPTLRRRRTPKASKKSRRSGRKSGRRLSNRPESGVLKEPHVVSKLVDDFRKGVVDKPFLERVQMYGSRSFELSNSDLVRPNQLGFSVDHEWKTLSRWIGEVKRNPLTKERVGGEHNIIPDEFVVSQKEEKASFLTYEEKRGLDDVCTKFCCETFFPDAMARLNMIFNIIHLFDEVASRARMKYRILFKGGIITRFLILEWLQHLSFGPRMEAIDYVSKEQKAVGISDFDFQVTFHPEHPPTEKDIQLAVFLNYIILLYVKKILHANICQHGKKTTDYIEARTHLLNINWDPDNPEKLVSMLEEHVKELPPSHSMYGAKIDYVLVGNKLPSSKEGLRERLSRYSKKNGNSVFCGKKDNFIFRCHGRKDESGEDEKCVASARRVLRRMGFSKEICDLASPSPYVYATHNSYIGEESFKDRSTTFLPSVFHLTRIKHVFTLFYTTLSGDKISEVLTGELVDLSCSAGTRLNLKEAYIHSLVDKPYAGYKVLGVSKNGGILRSWTVEGLFHDLSMMLHFEGCFPWENGKYEKRLIRYVCVFVILIFSTPGVDMPTKISELKLLSTQLLRPTFVSNFTIPYVQFFADREKKLGERTSCPELGVYRSLMAKHLRKMVGFVERGLTERNLSVWKNMENTFLENIVKADGNLEL